MLTTETFLKDQAPKFIDIYYRLSGTVYSAATWKMANTAFRSIQELIYVATGKLQVVDGVMIENANVKIIEITAPKSNTLRDPVSAPYLSATNLERWFSEMKDSVSLGN